MWSPAEIESALGRAVLPAGSAIPERLVRGVSIDSRSLQPQELFFCIVGDRTDGHEYVAQALERGAAGVVASRSSPEITDGCSAAGVPCFVVPDTTRALGELAAFHRRRLRASVIGITGSNGKTSTKEFLFALASQLEPGRVTSTAGNLNNQWGLPLSILRAQVDDALVILEMGMNHAGEIAALSQMAKPHLGLIVSVSGAHIGHFGSVLEIARAKLELAEGMAEGSFLLYSRHSPGLDLARTICRERKLQLLAFGVEDQKAVEVTAEGLRFPWRGRVLVAPGWFNPVLANNRIGALEALVALGYDEERVAVASESVRASVSGRFVVRRKAGPRGPQLLIDDTYNANEASFCSAVEAAAGLVRGGRLAIVAGEMGELGDESPAAHEKVGERAGQVGCALLVAVGSDAAGVLEKAYRASQSGGRSVRFADAADVLADGALLEEIAACDVVLVKGSRSARMERVVAALQEKGYV